MHERRVVQIAILQELLVKPMATLARKKPFDPSSQGSNPVRKCGSPSVCLVYAFAAFR